MDTCFIWTTHYYRQFSLSLRKESPYNFSKFNQDKTRQTRQDRQDINYYHNITSTMFWHAVSKKTLVEACQINSITNQILYYNRARHCDLWGRQCDQLLLSGTQIFTPGRQPGPQDR